MKRKICVVTGSRAEFGLLRWLMHKIKSDSELSLKIIATGMHLSPEFGSTFKEIEDAGFDIDNKIEMLVNSDTSIGVSKSIGLGLISFADIFDKIRPDILLVLGDRFEIFAAATAAMIANIPVAHIHGGESTEGAFDEALRHSITKMAHLHFVATDEYRQRVIQLGEQPDKIFNVGGLGIEAISNVKLLSRQELEKSLEISFSKKNLLITYHPVTLEGSDCSVNHVCELLDTLSKLVDTTLIITMPNADTGGMAIKAIIYEFANKCTNVKIFNSLGQSLYFSCLNNVDGIVGNSSSGLLEAPSFNIGTINIGNRQKGRIKAESIIDCEPNTDSISKALKTLYSSKFQKKLINVKNPYDNGHTSSAICEVLKKQNLTSICKKKFYDIPNSK